MALTCRAAGALAELDLDLVRSGLHRSHLGHLDELPSLRDSRAPGERARERNRSLEDAEHLPEAPDAAAT